MKKQTPAPTTKAPRGDAVTIALNNGMVAVVSKSDLHLVDNGKKWTAWNASKNRWYAVQQLKVSGVWKRVMMHRVVMGFPDNKLDIDHIDRNGLNNTRENLRVCTRSQNNHNAPKPINNTSGYRGVTWDKRKGRWLAQIGTQVGHKFLGYFDTAEKASVAYEDRRKELLLV
jgi:hypothetical protein